MRGNRSIYLPYVENPEDYTSSGRGRSDYLIARRDRKLILRYYYYTRIKHFNFEEIIQHLSFEFDLAERTITDRLQYMSEAITEIMNAQPPVFELKREFPYFSWS